MNAQQLKNAILQEAIQGRLVPQDPNDEPASVLLDRIRKEKAKLVKEGKLKKKDLVEVPISEEEKPFEIPESWEWVRIGSIFNHTSGKQLSSSNTEGTLHEYITTSNLYWGRFELDNLKSMYYKDSEIEKCTAKQGDLLVCEGGDIGRSAIWTYDYDICLQNHVHRLRPYDDRYTIFVYYIMWFYKNIGLIGGKGIGIQGLSATALKTIIVPLPPLAEQQRIVAKIEELLPKVEEYGKAQEALDKLNKELPERLKKSVLQEAIQGRLVPQDPNDEPASVLLDKIRKEKAKLVKEGKLKKIDLEEKPISEEEIPFEIPASWEWVRIRTIFSLQAGKNVTSDAINSEQDNIFKYPCFGGNGLRGYVKEYNTQGIYPLIGRQGALCGNVNIAHGKFWATEHAVVTDGYGMTSYKWQYYFLKALNLNQFATATAQPGLAVSTIIEVPIPLPPLAEQQRIVAKIEELFQEIDKLK